jgi:hypothetical protein
MNLSKPSLLALLTLILSSASSTACSPSAEADATEESNLDGAADDVFSKADAMPLTISAPLSTLFAKGVANPDYSEPGQLTFIGGGLERTVDIKVSVRGESSKKDCPFTKLKIEFTDKAQLDGTPFKGHGKMRLNTHCGPGDVSARSEMGRVFNGVGPVREELTYRLIRAAGIPTYRTRVTAIHYTDTADFSKSLNSFGMLVESGNDAAQRFASMTPPLVQAGWSYLDPAEARSIRISATNTAQIAIAEAFSGNKDWGGTHNIDSFGIANGSEGFQMAQDFDLGAIVLGEIARYWKGVAPVTDAQRGLQDTAAVMALKSRKPAMEAAYREAEVAMIRAKAIASTDGTTTTDPGFLEAKRRIAGLFALLGL